MFTDRPPFSAYVAFILGRQLPLPVAAHPPRMQTKTSDFLLRACLLLRWRDVPYCAAAAVGSSAPFQHTPPLPHTHDPALPLLNQLAPFPSSRALLSILPLRCLLLCHTGQRPVHAHIPFPLLLRWQPTLAPCKAAHTK